MKKVTFLVVIMVFIVSCSSSKVCGGRGGKRCVQAENNDIVHSKET